MASRRKTGAEDMSFGGDGYSVAELFGVKANCQA